ncbi:MAG TPA: chorismate mutase [Geminicoccaceae bacterium]|nr:chorismate mutase [Geminicoccaceae bacterium]
MAGTELSELRVEVDLIDRAIVDLLVERLAVVRRIKAIKGGDGRPAIRPAREAVILRTLVAQAGEGFPKAPLVRIWRELLAATTRAQGPFTVAAYIPAGMPELWDVTRDHFGSLTPIARADSSTQALRAVADGRAQVAVLPLPDEQDLWWQGLLAADDEARPRIVARLPFANAGQYPAAVGAVVLARLDQEPTGDDLTLLAIEAEGELSRSRLKDALDAQGLAPRWLAAVRAGDGRAAVHLLEVPGFVTEPDPHLVRALEPLRRLVLRVQPVGGYARPFSGAELA